MKTAICILIGLAPFLDFFRIGRVLFLMSNKKTFHVNNSEFDMLLMKLSFNLKLLISVIGMISVLFLSDDLAEIIFLASFALFVNYVLFVPKIREFFTRNIPFVKWLGGLYLPLCLFVLAKVIGNVL